MIRLTIKTLNNRGDKCKTYVYDNGNGIVFEKLTLVTDKDFDNMEGGETIIKKTDNYTLTLHWFAIKKGTLLKALTLLNLVPPRGSLEPKDD